MKHSIVQSIQAMLAPGVAISAVGLLLLSLSNRYSAVINRIRLLNDERRRYLQALAGSKALTAIEDERLHSVERQTWELLARVRLVRDGILALQAAIGLFVLTSVAIGAQLVVPTDTARGAALVLFVLGMVAVVVGMSFGGLEVYRAYRIISFEVMQGSAIGLAQATIAPDELDSAQRVE